MDALTRDAVRTKGRSRRFGLGSAVLCALAVAAIIWAVWFFPAARPPSKKAGVDASATVPVMTVPAVAKDVPIYQDGLGTVQAFYTVTIKAMVDGPLIAVDFTEGQTVHKGEVLAQIDPRIYQAALDSAVAKKAQDEAQLANARLDLARYQKLVANNYTSAQQADTAKAQVAQFEAQVRQDQAQIDNARTELSYTTITAPIDGRTGIRLVDPGNIVHATDATGLVVITQLQPIAVIFTLPQQALPAVARAMQAGIPPTALALAQGDTSTVLDTGSLTVLDNQVDPNTGTLKLKATFPNTQHLLWPGGFVTVRLQTGTAHDAVTVPPSVVQRGPGGSYLFVIGPDNKAQRREITVGYQDEHVAIVTSGLKAGETVVTDGASRLADGTVVSLARPSGAPARPAEPTAPGTGRQQPGPG